MFSWGHVIIPAVHHRPSSSIIFQRARWPPPTSGAIFLGRSFWDDPCSSTTKNHLVAGGTGGGFSIISPAEVKPKYFVPLPPKLKPMDHWVGTPGREDWIEGWELDVFRHFFHYKSCVYLCIYIIYIYILSIIIIHIYSIYTICICMKIVCGLYDICNISIYAYRIHDLPKDRFPISSGFRPRTSSWPMIPINIERNTRPMSRPGHRDQLEFVYWSVGDYHWSVGDLTWPRWHH